MSNGKTINIDTLELDTIESLARADRELLSQAYDNPWGKAHAALHSRCLTGWTASTQAVVDLAAEVRRERARAEEAERRCAALQLAKEKVDGAVRWAAEIMRLRARVAELERQTDALGKTIVEVAIDAGIDNSAVEFDFDHRMLLAYDTRGAIERLRHGIADGEAEVRQLRAVADAARELSVARNWAAAGTFINDRQLVMRLVDAIAKLDGAAPAAPEAGGAR